MRLSRLTLAFLTTLLVPCTRAQDAILVLTPAPAVSVSTWTGIPSLPGDNGAGSSAQLAAPGAMAKDAQGNLYIADTRNHRVRRILSTGTISTIAGTGVQGNVGDGGPATQAQLDSPSGVAVDTDGTVYIADTRNHRIRRVDTSGIIHAWAGIGTSGYSGDGAAALVAQLNHPLGIALGIAGDLYIADSGNHRVRRVSATGTIATVAGDGIQGVSPDGTPVTAAHLDTPAAIAVRSDGAVLIADRRNDRVVKLDSDGTLHVLETAKIKLRRPAGMGLNEWGDVLVADTGHYRVAQVNSRGAGLVLGSGEQGARQSANSSVESPIGAPSAVVGAVAGTAPSFAVLDKEHGQVLQATIPRITFPDTTIAASSLLRSLLLRNAGTSILTVTDLNVPRSFSLAKTSTCGSVPFAVAAAATCSLDLVFTPETDGSTQGLLEVSASSVATQRVVLSGNGVRLGTALTSSTTLQTSGAVAYAGMPVALSALVLGSATTSPTGTVTFLDGSAELGTANLNAAAQAQHSAAGLLPGLHALTARYSGDKQYAASVSAVSAVTVVAPPDFTFGPNSNTRVAIQSGAAGSLALSLQPLNGVLNRNISIMVDGLPSGATVNVTPVPVLLASDPVTVNIAFKLPVSLSQQRRPNPLFVALLFPYLLAHRRYLRSFVLLFTGGLLALTAQGCGGGYLSDAKVTSQNNAATYAVTVTASCRSVTGQMLTHTTTFTVVVQS